MPEAIWFAKQKATEALPFGMENFLMVAELQQVSILLYAMPMEDILQLRFWLFTKGER